MNNLNNESTCKFGVITDVQYANIDNRPALYNSNKIRYYRDSLIHLKKAFNYWNSLEVKPNFVLQLGDLIDGLNNNEISCNSLVALNKTIDIFDNFSHIPIFHAVGNHELYNFSRKDIALLFRESLIKRIKINPDLVDLKLDFHNLPDEDMLLYYKFSPIKGIKVIALDCFDISVIGYSKDNIKYKKAEEILYNAHSHRNFDLWDFDVNLIGINRRFQAQNGGISDTQLNWLRNELKMSEKNDEKVVVFGHVCLHPNSCDASCLLYNYEQVINTFNDFNCVICYLSGHAHKKGYAYEQGIHYIVLHGIIEANPKQEAFTTITIDNENMIVEGKGIEQNFKLKIRKNTSNEINHNICYKEDLLNTKEFNNDQIISSVVKVFV